ncbi:HAD-IA family hydrolase [Alphaproteobacteria bacterium GH1-50]|uniref:HAD-IA family hydrolase n=1 Tax=Kangsaoukella pontilimi TaxID=2691042 RepID=A0A7C9MBI3_9RHOB|nr:HAD family phosphatase [Kangsaoukella pontilimi]MXQ06851.1 HAD-IA family hydrolase [Kangsaoukella pontilimi]
MERVVVFDIGMVLVEWHPERVYDARIGQDARKRLFEEADLHKMNALIDLGGHSRDVAYSHAKKFPHWADEIRAWHDDWLSMLSPDIPGSAALLRALKAKGIKVVALTNFGWDTLELAQANYPILNEFDDTFVSGRLGVIKPDPAIYEHVERGTGKSGAELVFADDSLKNVEAARARGWVAHHFTQPEGWAEVLVAEGLLTADEARAALASA